MVEHRLALQRDCVHICIVVQQMVDDAQAAAKGCGMQDASAHSVHRH